LNLNFDDNMIDDFGAKEIGIAISKNLTNLELYLNSN
jgi:RNase H-fold protein (predicted Holliday junction resolvase)